MGLITAKLTMNPRQYVLTKIYFGGIISLGLVVIG